ncbi:MAG: glycosyltransferase family 39 protein, partial [Planctomycetaceae bacterium]
MNHHSTDSGRHFSWTLVLVVGMAAFFLSASRVNHGLVGSPLPNGPGLTTDESINIRQGIYLFDAFIQHGPLMLFPGTAQDVYSHPEYMADYVPLGRFLLGAFHELTSWAISGAELSVVNVPAARLASSFALAVTVMLMMAWTGKRYGMFTAVIAAALFLLMPRVVGHSRIASLETLTTLAWLAALIPLLCWWTNERPPSAWQAVVSGLMWGILMLVKIQAVFLPPVITLFAIAMFRMKALRPLTIMAMTGLIVFFCGWPWLWLDPIHNPLSYLMSTTDRLPVNNWYMGHRYADKATPWHYPFMMAAVTIPLHTCGGLVLRLLQRRLDAAEHLLLLSVALPMTAFAIPGTPVYDGTRLFLFVMPGVAILAARGLALFVGNRRVDPTLPAGTRSPWPVSPKKLVAIMGALFVLDVAVTITQLGPFAGDAYNGLARLLNPAEETLECSYWGGALNSDFWEQVPHGSTVAVAPVLHSVLLQDMMSMIPIVRQRQIVLEPFYYEPAEQRGLVLLLHRLADLPPELRQPPPGNQPVVEIQLDRRVLARLIDTSQRTWLQKPEW